MRLQAGLAIPGAMAALVVRGCSDNNPKPPNRDHIIASSAESLAVPLIDQEGANWCWAASCQMVMAFLGDTVPQWVQANSQFVRRDCCPAPGASGCDIGACDLPCG